MPIDNVINEAVNAGRWVVMQHEEGTIITGRANILENVIKAGHVQAFYGRHSQAILSPSPDMSFLMLVVAQRVRRMPRLR